MRPLRLLTHLLLLLLAAALVLPLLWVLYQSARPIPTLRYPAAVGNASALVVVLPGIEGNLERLSRSGMVEAVQQSLPHADVVLAGASPAYYLRHNLVDRLHREVLEPARRRGIGEIWLVGESMGGFGSLLYERAYPGAVSGIVLLAPFMGRPGLRREIERAGGLAQWNPGPQRSWWHPDQTPASIWSLVRSWRGEPQAGRRIWLACGTQDDFLASARLIAGALPPDHVIELEGAHERRIWVEAARKLLARAQAARLAAAR